MVEEKEKEKKGKMIETDVLERISTEVSCTATCERRHSLEKISLEWGAVLAMGSGMM